MWSLADVSSSVSTHTSAVCYQLARSTALRFSQQLLHIYKKPRPWGGSGWPVHRCCFGKRRWALSRRRRRCKDGSLKKLPLCAPGSSRAARGSRCFTLSPVGHRWSRESNSTLTCAHGTKCFSVCQISAKLWLGYSWSWDRWPDDLPSSATLRTEFTLQNSKNCQKGVSPVFAVGCSEQGSH